MRNVIVGAVAACTVTFADLQAQTRQRFSAQVSGVYQIVGGDIADVVEAGPGLEAQLRMTKGSWSFGVGVDVIWHPLELGEDVEEVGIEDASFRFLGLFFEPRYVFPIASRSAAPYVSGRLGVARSRAQLTIDGEDLEDGETGYTANVGGGVLFRLTPRVNLDVGATVGSLSWESDRAGWDAVFRAGLSFGLGR